MNLDTCADCGGRLDLTNVSASDSTAVESYECEECGGTGTYVNEFGVPGGGVHGSGVVGR